MTVQVERQKSAELLALLGRVQSIPQDGLGKFICRHLDEMPAWKEWLGPDPTNAAIASKVGRRLSSLAYTDKICLNEGRYMSIQNAKRFGLIQPRASS